MADRVRIYRNLHKGSLSIKDWDRQSPTYGRVIDRPNVYFVSYPRFIVSKAGRDRVLREKRKNVHAFVQGHPYSGKKEAVTEHKGFEGRLPFHGGGSPSIGNTSFSPDAIIYDWEREIFEDLLLEGMDPEEILEKKISKQVLTDADKEVHLARKFLEHTSS